MRTPVVLAVIALGIVAGGLILACSSRGWEGEVVQSGTFEDVLHDGNAEGRVPLAGITENDDGDEKTTDATLIGVGALEKLTGEVTIVDGKVWITRVRDGELVTERARGIGGKASMLASARVNEWSAHTVAEDVAGEALSGYLKAEARAAGIEAGRPFPFRVEGPLMGLSAHVIAGDCPMRARRNGVEANPAPVMIAEDAIEARLVGIFAEGREGELTHHGTQMHVHVVGDGEKPFTAHVEDVGIKAGSTLYLPAR